MCCCLPSTTPLPTQQMLYDRRAVVASAIITLALIVLGTVLAAGLFTPGISYHYSAYLGGTSFALAIVALAATYFAYSQRAS